ncbi:MAG: hypothetical protein F6J93_39345 [Oscillatoria sp. SIO1A7]|nr:hypothetical protein [Oscillatoria sp. SIO1A7]
MTQLLIEDIEPTLIAKLEHMADRNKRSLQEELKSILHQAAESEPYRTGGDMVEFRERILRLREKYAGRPSSVDSVELLRENRGW